MEEQEVKVNQIRIGPKEETLLKYLYQEGEVRIFDIYSKFATFKKYRYYLAVRLHRLEERGLVTTIYKYNEKTKVQIKYITLTDFGKQVVENQILSQS